MATKRKTSSRDDKACADERIHSCAEPVIRPRELSAGMPSLRERLIRVNEKKWANGTVLHYYFFDRGTDGAGGSWVGPAAQKQAVRDAFDEWKGLGVGLEFREVSSREEAEIRVGFDQSDGSWSYVGRDSIDHASDPNERTMNFGWDLTTPYGRDTALHEIGHALGFPHEHQNPNAGIVWDEDAVYAYYAGSPNYWSRSTTRHNILRKLDPTEVSGSTWDRDSIMHYWIGAGLVLQPADLASGHTPAPGLSETDIAEVRKFYPSLEEERERELRPYESQRLMMQPSEQVNFRIRPERTKRYTIQTFGATDTVMVLFEDEGGAHRYIDGDDDSGWKRNAKIEERLYRGREYILRLRLYYSYEAGQSAVFMY